MFSILLVDDEPDIRSAWQLILELEGFHVLCAENGKRALERLEHHLPTLVITDWTMPRMHGGELCREIRGQRRLAGLPIVIHSSIEQPAAGEISWSVFLRKPCQVDVFVDTARRLCVDQLQSCRSRLHTV
ncbi:response regulator [Paraburkholderia kirstenboschensis]|uniref:response regulator n=1 Tax=Paraburkholderia kirstenboschensis TaxID=1245436 RepID=UPI000FFBC40C|nr:response regulator [Paraburkholderia kirstenboschensis]